MEYAKKSKLTTILQASLAICNDVVVITYVTTSHVHVTLFTEDIPDFLLVKYSLARLWRR